MATPKDDVFVRLEQLIKNSVPAAMAETSSIAEIVASMGSPSLSMAVLDNGNITKHNISVPPQNHNADTLFQACSISKPCGGLGIMKLIEKGLFSLDDKACSLLPEYVVKNMTSDPRSERLMRGVTVKHLLSHTAGLSIHGFPGYPAEYYPPKKLPSPAEVIAGGKGVHTAQVKVIIPPGLEFMYSGGGMTVLQAIAEHVTGRGFDEVMQELVLDPLEMKRSFYKLRPNEDNVAQVWWTGATKCDTQWHFMPELMAAGLWTTPEDLLKLVRALQTSLKEDVNSDQPRFLRRELAKAVITPVKSTMGLTWFCNEAALGHGGSNQPGYRSMLFGYADLPWNTKKEEEDETSILEKASTPDGCGISVMTNGTTGQEVMWTIIHALAYLKGWPEAPCFFLPVEAGVPLAADGDIESGKNSDWKQWIGEWWDKEGSYAWKIAENQKGSPIVTLDETTSEEPLRLRTAAMPPLNYKGGRKSIDLLVEGMEVVLRLGWTLNKTNNKEERSVEAWWVCELQSARVLSRKSA